VKTANEFAEVLAAVGLAQNLAALRALVMKAFNVGICRFMPETSLLLLVPQKDIVNLVAEKMVKERKIRMDRAKELSKS